MPSKLFSLLVFLLLSLGLFGQNVALVSDLVKGDMGIEDDMEIKNFNGGYICVGQNDDRFKEQYFIAFVKGKNTDPFLLKTCTLDEVILIGEMNGSFYFLSRAYSENSAKLYKTNTGQDTTLVKEFAYGQFTEAIIFNNAIYMSLGESTSSAGIELWKSDGTTVGTTLFKELVSGSNSGLPSSFKILNNELFFFAVPQPVLSNDLSQLWKTNGTLAGTVMVKDFTGNGTFYNSFAESSIAFLNGEMFFSINTTSTSVNIWKTNGTNAGTSLYLNATVVNNQLISDLISVNNLLFFQTRNQGDFRLYSCNGVSTSATELLLSGNYYSIQNLFAGPNNLYFMLYTSSLGLELYKSDGTVAGTGLLKDIYTGPSSSGPQDFFNYNSFTFFRANVGFSNKLFRTNGTAAGTIQVSSPEYSINDIFVAQGDTLFWQSITIENEFNGYELFYYSLIDNSTGFYSNLNKTPANSYPNEMHVRNDSLYYAVNDYDGYYQSIYYSTGDSINSNYIDYYLYDINFRQLDHITNTDFWFTKSSSIDNNQPVFAKYDQSGTTDYLTLKDKTGYLRDGTDFYMVGWPTYNTNPQLFKFNNGVTTQLSSFTNTSNMTVLNKAGNWIYFKHSEPSTGLELYKTDGTIANTSLVIDLNVGSSDGYYSGEETGVFNNELYFYGRTNSVGQGLYRTNGTAAATILVKSFSSSNLVKFFKHNNKLYFLLREGSSGDVGLWKTNGTPASTIFIGNLINLPSNNQLKKIKFVESNNGFLIHYVQSYGSFQIANKLGLFGFDSLANNVTQLHSSNIPSDFDLNIKDNAQFIGKRNNSEIYFTGASPTHGMEIWKTDGTVAGTSMLVDLNPGVKSSSPVNYTLYNNEMYIGANNGVTGHELFKILSSGPCPNTLSLSGTISNTQKANVSVTTIGSNTIPIGANVTYQAGNFIQLNPGFSTGSSTVFMTKLLGGCQ